MLLRGLFANTVTVEADSAEQACALAIESANASDGWRSLDHCGPTFVDVLAPGADVDPWTSAEALASAPAGFTEGGAITAREDR